MDSGSAFLRANSSSIEAISSSSELQEQWHYIPSNPNGEPQSWQQSNGRIILPFSTSQNADNNNIYQTLRFERSIRSSHNNLPANYNLRNGLPIPSLGLGTGGLDPDRLYETIATSVRLGYRLFDLAREYRNEYIFRDIIHGDETIVGRGELFLESKVWPTELGVDPTSRAIEASLFEIETSYVDLYLLHWPR